MASVEALVENQVGTKKDETTKTLKALSEILGPHRLSLNAPLAPYTTFRIGGPADILYDATSADELASAVQAAKSLNTPWFVLGTGANVLISDRGFRGLVIRNKAAKHQLLPDGRLTTESGAIIQDLVLESVRNGFSGLEHFVGIPSTVGGALWQNLHFLSPAPERNRTVFISEVFRSCEILAEDGTRRQADAQYIQFGYDDSVFHHKRDIVLNATFQLTPANPDVLHKILQENLAWRGSRHPWLNVHPSAGSIFKKIEGAGAGRLIDQCGLKGFRIGDAQISHIHANIIVNLGHASAADVRALIAHAQHSVQQRFGLDLRTEIGMVGEF